MSGRRRWERDERDVPAQGLLRDGARRGDGGVRRGDGRRPVRRAAPAPPGSTPTSRWAIASPTTSDAERETTGTGDRPARSAGPSAPASRARMPVAARARCVGASRSGTSAPGVAGRWTPTRMRARPVRCRCAHRRPGAAGADRSAPRRCPGSPPCSRRSYNEARTIGERYRDGVPVIMNLTELPAAAGLAARRLRWLVSRSPCAARSTR